MRPVLLEMDGFGSFREPAVVDFADADYFVLVGPTGSGKSTVIDAMTFALFGSVPRWNDKRMVSLALAPTANRGTVRLVFDVGPNRYVVARELRRTSQGVTVKSARLERLDDATGIGALTESTDVLAAESGVTAAVERLLGLTFENFCQCVVLPQGEFAEFLRAKPSERQKILLKLLGAQRYEAIGREANSRAAGAGQRAVMLAEQLSAFADATEDAESAAAAREDALATLADRVAAALPELQDANRALDAAQTRCDRLTVELETLRAVQLPGDVTALDEARSAADTALTVAWAAEDAAQSADTTARERLAAAPARGPLEQARRDHAEHARIVAVLPGARAAVKAVAADREQAAIACAAAGAALETARAARDSAAAAAEAAASEAHRVADEHTRLTTVTMPVDLPELNKRGRDARGRLTAAGDALTAAEERDAAARDRLEDAPVRGPLEKALADLAALAQATGTLPSLAAAHQHATKQLEQARTAISTAAAVLHEAHAAREVAAMANRAAALRPHLTAGDACPVCEQTVAVVPPPLRAPELAAADEAVVAATAELDRARGAEASAGRAEAKAAAAYDAATERIAQLHAGLPGQPDDEAAVRDGLAHLDELASTVGVAAAEVHQARADRAQAQREVSAAETAVAALRAALHTARDPLVALAAPAVNDADLLDAWTSLIDWAQQEAAVRAALLPPARAAVQQAAVALHTAEQAFVAAGQEAARSRTAETHACAACERAEAALEGFESRLAKLSAVLADAPSDAEAQTQLARLGELEAALKNADAHLRAVRERRKQAETVADQLKSDIAAAWQQLRVARDRLVPLGAPELDGASLVGGWTGLLTWAEAEAGDRLTALPSAREAVPAAGRRRDELARGLSDELAAHDVVLPDGELVTTAPVAFAAARERARGDRVRLSERRAQAGQLDRDRTVAKTEQQVAKLLGDLLRSDQFPRWLVAAALDVLVVDASASLAELSGGQFELTHKAGEFYVVDHADADSQRSVRTLSGGETFQASLALALALSAQMSSLAAAGAARLDSIFLDEGFGTLDAATLEVVAETLENLAHGDRMVGVITHVPALAELVPVRLLVSRDHRTSTVVREEV